VGFSSCKVFVGLLRVRVGTHLSLNEQNCWLMTCQTISSDDMVKGAVVRKFVSRRKYLEGRAACNLIGS
jgi:hypothetical protein